MRILVTGAAGFIGSHAVDVMRAAGHEVQGLDSLTPAVHTGRPDYLPDNFDLAVGDVRDPDAVRRAVAGADVVCHQAALVGLGVDLADLPAYSDVNVTGTAVLLEAMGRSGVPRLVLASSMVVYGEGAYDCPGHGRVRPAAAGRERPGGGPLRAPLPGVLGAAHRGHRHRGRAARSPQRLRGQQARPGASGRHLGPDDRRVGGRAPVPQRVRAPDAAGHALLRRGGDLPVRAGRGPARRRSTRTASSGATSCTCTTWPGPTWPRCGPGCPARCGPSTWPAGSRTRWARWRRRWPACSAAPIPP